jgi:hypothetical protein
MATQWPVDVNGIVPDYNMFGHHRLFNLNENDEPAESNRKAHLPTDEDITSKDRA